MAYDLATVTNSGNQLLASVVPDHSSLTTIVEHDSIPVG